MDYFGESKRMLDNWMDSTEVVQRKDAALGLRFKEEVQSVELGVGCSELMMFSSLWRSERLGCKSRSGHHGCD